MARFVVSGEVDPDGGVVIGFVGHLNGIAESGLEIPFRVELQPKADGPGPVLPFKRNVALRFVEDRPGVFAGEAQSIAGTGLVLGVVDILAIETGLRGRLFLVAGGMIELGVSSGYAGVDRAVEGSPKDDVLLPIGCISSRSERDGAEQEAHSDNILQAMWDWPLSTPRC